MQKKAGKDARRTVVMPRQWAWFPVGKQQAGAPEGETFAFFAVISYNKNIFCVTIFTVVIKFYNITSIISSNSNRVHLHY